jgi:cellulose 1,4-beta-cellobiosidase
MKLVTGSGSTANVGSRVYLMDTSDKGYQMFNLKNQEFTVDIDVSGLPCGLNGALYFVSMDSDGGQARNPTNKAGAKYGTGYCDSQCPKDIKFIDGVANSAGWTPSATSANTGAGGKGSCCSEMDIWEANSISEAYTPHPCQPVGYKSCSDATSCGSSGYCDHAGCDFNSYRMGNTSFYGPGKTIDTTKKITAVTQFLTSDGTASGDLTEIRRFYVQNGVTYANSQSDIAGVTGNSLTESFCDAQKTAFGDTNTFKADGGLKAMGDAFQAGMVLVMSIWDDYAVNMLWLDSAYPTDSPTTNPGVVRGTCATTSGNPKDIEANTPGATVVYSNIKVGPIGSTFSPPAGGNPSPVGGSSSAAPPKSSSTSVKPVSSSTKATSAAPVTSTKATTAAPVTSVKPTTSAPAANCAARYGQ